MSLKAKLLKAVVERRSVKRKGRSIVQIPETLPL